MATPTRIFTYTTQPEGTNLIVAAPDNEWKIAILFLEQPGNVSCGEDADLVPVGAGKGRLLPFSEEIRIVLAPGARLYVAATSVVRVAVQVEPIPWLEAIVRILQTLPMPKQLPGIPKDVVDVGSFAFDSKLLSNYGKK